MGQDGRGRQERGGKGRGARPVCLLVLRGGKGREGEEEREGRKGERRGKEGRRKGKGGERDLAPLEKNPGPATVTRPNHIITERERQVTAAS